MMLQVIITIFALTNDDKFDSFTEETALQDIYFASNNVTHLELVTLNAAKFSSVSSSEFFSFSIVF